MVLSREGDCTGRAVREQSCPFDFEAFETLTLCVSCAYAAFCIECQALYARDPCVTLCVMGLASAHQNDVLRQRRVYIDVAARGSRVTPRRSSAGGDETPPLRQQEGDYSSNEPCIDSRSAG